MTAAEYLRRKARLMRELADNQTDQDLKAQLLELAEHCEKLANDMTSNSAAG